ncbi:MAG: PA2779 family protein [Desulfobacterales bacterium]|jgi:hypothetical protein
MQAIRRSLKPVGMTMAIFLLVISGPYQSALAAMVGTEGVMEASQGQQSRDRIKQLLVREDIRQALVNQGIDMREANNRIDSLSDTEAIAVAEQLDKLPAGGGALEVFLIVALIAFIILLITDIMGYTDIFPFVK